MTARSSNPSHSGIGAIPAMLSGVVGILLLASAVGFYPSYLSQFPRFENSDWQVHFHLLTVLAWFCLLLVQARLAAKGRFEKHRTVGRWSYALVPLIIVGFVLVAHYGQRRNPEPALLGAAIFDGGLFLLFYVLAMVNRRNSAYHSRYLLLATVAFMNAPIGRAIAPEVSVPLQFLVMLGLLVVAKLRARPWKPFMVGVVAYVVWLGAILVVNPPA